MSDFNFKPVKIRLKRLSPLEAGVVFVLLLILLLLFTFLPVTYKDWLTAFRPAALHWLRPYYQPGMAFNPPWLYFLLYPLAILPERLGAGLLMLMSVIIISAYVGSPKKAAVVILSAPMITLFTLGQLDALSILGLMIPYGLGAPLLLAKPQGVFLSILRRLNRYSMGLILLTFIISILIWGFWWQEIMGYRPNQEVNVSLFPYSIGPGLILLYFGLKGNSDALLCFASLCFAPYFMITSLLPGLAALVRETKNWRWWAAVSAGSWIYLLITRALTGQL